VLGAFDEMIAWFSGLTAWGKVRLLVIVAALAWLLFIAAPSLVISTLAADNVTDLHGAIAFVQTSTPQPFDNPAAAQAGTLDESAEMLAAPAAPQAESAGAADANAASLVEAAGMTVMSANPAGAEPSQAALQADAAQEQPAAQAAGEQVAALDAQSQAAPTETPYIIVVTNTPPPPTDTPLPPTETPVPPTNTPRPVADVRPASQPQPTATPAERPQPPRALDERLSALNVNVQPIGVRAGQSYWRLVEARWADEQQAAGAHSIFVNALDENGTRLAGQPVEIRWAGGSLTVSTESKPAPEYSANFPMYNTLGSYSVRIAGLPSDVIVGLGLGTIQAPNFKVHTCFYLTFQRTTR